MSVFRFYLGVFHADWLAELTVPMFVSHHTLAKRRTLPRAAGQVAVDSGAFTEIDAHGAFRTSPEAYATAVRRYRDEIGIQWAAPQDWPCEPRMLAKTGMTVVEHQARSVGSYLRLKELAPDLPFIPVLQGWSVPGDYDACRARYERAGIDLGAEPVVGLGSVCRRQASAPIALLAGHFADLGVKLHGFGVSSRGLGNFAADLVSADSMAWSLGGRYVRGCAHGSGAKTEADCRHHALAWRQRVLAAADPPHRQLTLPGL